MSWTTRKTLWPLCITAVVLIGAVVCVALFS